MHGGFVEVKDNQVIMLADEAELAAEIDVEAARRAERGGRDGQASLPERENALDQASRRTPCDGPEVRLEAAGRLRDPLGTPSRAAALPASRSRQGGAVAAGRRWPRSVARRRVAAVRPAASARPRTPNRV